MSSLLELVAGYVTPFSSPELSCGFHTVQTAKCVSPLWNHSDHPSLGRHYPRPTPPRRERKATRLISRAIAGPVGRWRQISLSSVHNETHFTAMLLFGLFSFRAFSSTFPHRFNLPSDFTFNVLHSLHNNSRQFLEFRQIALHILFHSNVPPF